MIKNIIQFTACFLLIYNLSIAQNHNWITPNKTYLKMYLYEDGMYQINRTDFTNAGIVTTGIDPRTVKVLYKGAQVPIYFSGEADGVFNDNDYFHFYGQRNHGGPTKTYTESNVVSYITNEYYDFYSDTSAYWVDWGGAAGTRYSSTGFTTTNLYPNSYYFDTAHFEKDKLYSQGEHVSDADLRFLNNEKFNGEGWYWTLLSNGQTLSDTLSTPDLSTVPDISSFRIFAYPLNRSTTIQNEHRLELLINGTLFSTIYTNHFTRIDSIVNIPTSLLSSSSVNTVSVRYISAEGFSGNMYIDLFEINYPKLFRFRNKQITFSLPQTDTTSKLFSISGYSSATTLNIYDVLNKIKITSFSSNGDTLKFTGKGNGKYVVINDSVRTKPFRIKQRLVPDLVSNSNGADYLIIYNSIFTAQAEQLRGYRATHDNFRSVKAEIEDIYDIFYFGMENPKGVRNFVRHVSDNWQQPKVKFLCLFGRGSLDPKRNSTASVYYNNLVPVYGFPNTDGYFSHPIEGSFYFNDLISTGRLPAFYPAEAQSMVDKIIGYENEGPAEWWKRFGFITGGAILNEQLYYQQTSNFEINTYVTPRPISGLGVKIYRTDTIGLPSYNYADSIKRTINRGLLYLNFRGHAGSHDWEVAMSDPNVLDNGNRLPLIASLTCFTGENAKGDFRGFGERFIYLNGKGAIGFVGTSGWSYALQGNDFGTYMLQSVKIDTLRRIGDLLKSAGMSMRNDSSQFSVRHTVNCYDLLGDPAVTLKLPKFPEFVITNNDYKLSQEAYLLDEPNSLTIYPKNFGLFADSCKIRFQLSRYNQVISTRDTVYKNFAFLDSILFKFSLDSHGIYTMQVTLDQDNWYQQENPANNSITFNIPVAQNSFSPIKPVDNSVVYKDSVELRALNPSIDFSNKPVRVILQLDTSKSFNSPLTQTFVNNVTGGAVTTFRTLLPSLVNNTLYFWRTNSIINNDSSGWSRTQRFIYNNGGGVRDVEIDRYTNSQIPVVIVKNKAAQYSQTDFDNTNFNQAGIKLNEESIRLFVRSLGSNGDEASYFSVGNTNLYIDGFGVNAGLNMIKVRKLNGTIVEFKNLKMTSAASSDSLVTFLNTYDTTHYLMLLNAAYVPNGTSLSANAKSKLRQFGSVYSDSIGLLGYFHTWSLIGYLGAPPSEVSEMFDPCCRPAPNCVSCDHWAQSVSSKNVLVRKVKGSVSNIVGPANIWTDFSWNEMMVPNASITFDVIGISKTGQQTLLMSNVQSEQFVDLSSIDAYVYPKLNLLAKFNIDTLVGSSSPSLTGMRVNYTPAAELVLDRNSLQVSSDTRGNNVLNYSFEYHNAGYVYINGIVVNAYNIVSSDSNLISTDTVSVILKTDSTLTYSGNITIPEQRDSSRVYINIVPKGRYNEFYTYNNSVDFGAPPNVTGNITSVEVTSDGKKIVTGDYVRKTPEIKIALTESNNFLLTSDTARLALVLNNIYVPYYINGGANPVLKSLENDNQNPGLKSVVFYPELSPGKNKLSVVFRDDEKSDTVDFDVIVSDVFGVKDFYNFPNPMKSQTNFVFDMSGQTSTGKLKIKIYTVNGRLIKEIEAFANFGFNSIPWDGKDTDGDFVANGTYLYKLIAEDDSRSETPVQKLVVLK